MYHERFSVDQSIFQFASAFGLALAWAETIHLFFRVAILRHLLGHLFCSILSCHCNFLCHYGFAISMQSYKYTVLVVVLTDFETPPPAKPPPLLKVLLENELEKPPPLPPLKKSSFSNILLPKPKEPKLPNMLPLLPPLPFLLPKKLLKKGSSSNS